MIQINDWVRFYQNGKLVIGLVQYTRKNILGHTELLTDVGSVCDNAVLEYRSPTREK
jgi:hypothetical protein